MNRVYAHLLACLVVGLLPVAAMADMTGPAGGGGPQTTVQPSLGLSYLVRTQGYYNSSLVGNIGEVMLFAGNFAPGGYEFAAGQLMAIGQNQALFSLIGTTYGGDGVQTFALPDLGGRVGIGQGQGAGGLTNRTLGDAVGSDTVTLTAAQLASHAHTLPAPGVVTDPAGGSQPYNNMQPSLALNYMFPFYGIYPPRGFGVGLDAQEPVLGFVQTSAAASVPDDWATCAGQLLPISQNTALFSILGTTYGGDGKTTFALPDLRGRAPIGVGQGPGLTEQYLGEMDGAESVALNGSQLPAHTHTVTGLSGADTGVAGGGQPQTNMQPALGLNYVIALYGVYPSRDGGGTTDEPLVGQISLFAGNFAPMGWAFCDGSLVPISENTALFSILGTTYGGDGHVTFALPDLRGRLAVGAGGDGWLLGQAEGTELLTLTAAQMPQHAHGYVPEPATLSLLVFGGVALLRRKGPAGR